MGILERLKPDWKIVYDNDEEYFEITDDDGTKRLYCPANEAGTFGDILWGHEYPLSKSLRALAQGLPVVDIGGHVGVASCFFTKMLSPREVAIFEPGQRAQKYLDRNFPAVARHCAVTGWEGHAEYYEQGAMFLSTCLRPLNPADTYSVPCISGRSALSHVSGEIGVLKIDAEGSEGMILKSMGSELSRVRIVYLEWHNEKLRRQCDDALEDFLMFHCKGDWLQGVAGYVNTRYASHVHQEWEQICATNQE